MVEIMKLMVTSFKKSSACNAAAFSARTLLQATAIHASAGDSWTLAGKSGSTSCGVTDPFSWVLVHTGFCLYPPRVCSPSPV